MTKFEVGKKYICLRDRIQPGWVGDMTKVIGAGPITCIRISDEEDQPYKANFDVFGMDYGVWLWNEGDFKEVQEEPVLVDYKWSSLEL